PEKWTWTQHTPFKENYESRHRSVYLMTQRLQRHPFLALFDAPDTNSSTEARRTSIVPQQALFAMNDPWFDQQARLLARRVLSSGRNEMDQLQLLHELTWNRPPTREESKKCYRWLEEGMKRSREVGLELDACREEAWTVLARVALTSNEFLYVD